MGAKVKALEFLREGSICYVDETDDGPLVGRLYADAPVTAPLLAVAARDIQRDEVIDYDPERNTADMLVTGA